MSSIIFLSPNMYFESAKNWVYALNFEVVKEKTFILRSGNWKNSFLINFDAENTFFQFCTHDFRRSKRGLKCHSMACKHYQALFGSKWSYSTQKSQNGFFQWSGHCAMCSRKIILTIGLSMPEWRWCEYHFFFKICLRKMIVDFCREDLGLADLLWPAHTHIYS